MKIGLLIFPGCVASGLFAFAELLEAANKRSAKRAFETMWVGADEKDVPVTIGSKDMKVTISPQSSLLDKSLDAILMPGFWTKGSEQIDLTFGTQKALLQELKQLPPETTVWAYCTSVCLLAESGRLDHQTATSTWWLAQHLQNKYHHVNWSFTQTCIFQGENATASGVNGYLPIAQELITRHCGQDVLRDIVDLMVVPKPENRSQPFQLFNLIQLDDKLMRKIYVWVESKPAKELTIGALARALNLTERTLSRRIKAATKLSGAQFMRLIKVHQASGYLIYSSQSINSISDRLGFSDDAAFRRTFKNVSGYTPKEYRQAFSR